MSGIYKISGCREEILSQVFKNKKSQKNIGKIRQRWKIIIPKHYSFCYPQKLTESTLLVAVDNPIVHSELQFMKRPMAKKISEILNQENINIKFVIKS